MIILLFCLWVLFNGRITIEIVCFGVGLTALLYLFMVYTMDYSIKKELRLLRVIPFGLIYLINLIWETFKAAAEVLKVALRPSTELEPILVEFHSGLEYDALNVILANSITLTPGTITLFQEHDHFVIHSLRREYAQGIESSSFIQLLRRFSS